MTKRHSIRCVAFVGLAAVAVAYVGVLMAGLNDGGPRLDDLWRVLLQAPGHTVAAWAGFAAFGILAFAFRRRLSDHLLMAAAALVGVPLLWAVTLRYVYYDRPRGIWPGFQDETWRWLVTDVYAEFAFGILIGVLGVIASTADPGKRGDT